MKNELPSISRPPETLPPRICIKDFLLEVKAKSGLVPADIYGCGKHIIFILPSARQSIHTFFDFGKGRTAVNSEEQQAKLYGYVFTDEYDRYIYFITRAAYVYPAIRTHTFVATSGKNEYDIMEYLLRLEQEHINSHESECNTDKDGYQVNVCVNKYGVSEITAFIHTHPGFSCAPSSTDLASNESTVSHPYAYLICDPIGMNYSAMAGPKCENAKIVFLERNGEQNSHIIESCDVVPPCDIGTAQVAETCRAYLQKPGVKGKFRMFCDSKKKHHIKFNARFVCTGDKAEEFKMVKNSNAWR